jgi:hypothetical protein
MRGRRAAAAWLAIAAAAAACLPAVASAHEADVVGGTRAHAAADGLTGAASRSLARSWTRAQRVRRRALQRRDRTLRARGVWLLSDQQIRERVLMQSLGRGAAIDSGTAAGFASASGDYTLDRNGAPVTAPTRAAFALAAGGPSADAVDPSERGTKGEWSQPVQPNYPTFGPNISPATGFPNPEYPTGNFPGDPIVDTAQDYAANPDGSGLVNARYWSPNPRIVPIFEAMLPNGKVLYWDWYFSGNMNDPDQSAAHKQGTRVLLWDPQNPAAPGVRKDVPGANLFCAGFTQLPNGDLVLAGGNANADLEGLKTTFVYHWRSGLWTQSDNMRRTRWYPSVAATWNGESMIVGGDPRNENGQFEQGGNAVPEIFMSQYTDPSGSQAWNPSQPSPHLRKLGGLDWAFNRAGDPPRVPGWRLYPFLFPWVDGRVLYAGRETSLLMIDQRVEGGLDDPACVHPDTGPLAYPDNCNDGDVRWVAERADGQDSGGRQIVRTYGTGAYYDRGKVLVTGGDEDRVYDFAVPDADPARPNGPGKGPGWSTYGDGDAKVDGAFGDPGANWVCWGWAGGNPYSYSGNPYAAGAATRWNGYAPLVHVWNRAWCAGTNTVHPDKAHVNGASRESSLVDTRTTEGNQYADHDSPISKGWPTTREGAAMHYPRRMANLTVLPTGRLIATGGMGTTNAADDAVTSSEDYSGAPGSAENRRHDYAMNGNDANVNAQLVNYDRAVFASEQWDPATGQWTVLDSAHRPRQYHSTTILLADGRLMSGGGGVCSTCTTALYSEANFEFFKPPYLFWPDGTEKTANQRPRITGPFHSEGAGANANNEILPRLEYDGTLEIGFAAAEGEHGGGVPLARQAALIRLGAPTHGFDEGQRRVPVDLTVTGANTATIGAPPNPFEAPPGFYWLFLLDENGTPSVGKVVQVGAQLPLENKLRTATAFAERDFDDPHHYDNGASQDFGLGNYRASRGNLAGVRDDAMSSLKVASGFRAKVCRGDDLTDCANVPAGDYPRLGTAFEDHVSSLQFVEGPAGGGDVDRLTAVFTDTTAPLVTITSPSSGATVTTGGVAVSYRVSDDVSESDSAESPITCDQPSGHVFGLVPGSNAIAISCRDAAGNTATATTEVVHQPPLATPPAANAPVFRAHVPRQLRNARKLRIPVLCEASCRLRIAISGGGLNIQPASVGLAASPRTRIAQVAIGRADVARIAGRLRKHRRIRVRVWLNDVPQGAGSLRR